MLFFISLCFIVFKADMLKLVFTFLEVFGLGVFLGTKCLHTLDFLFTMWENIIIWCHPKCAKLLCRNFLKNWHHCKRTVFFLCCTCCSALRMLMKSNSHSRTWLLKANAFIVVLTHVTHMSHLIWAWLVSDLVHYYHMLLDELLNLLGSWKLKKK